MPEIFFDSENMRFMAWQGKMSAENEPSAPKSASKDQKLRGKNNFGEGKESPAEAKITG